MPVGSRAARVAGWRKDVGAWPAGGTLAGTPFVAPFPQTPLATTVQIYVDGSWIDVTVDVFGGNRADIQISRGAGNEAAHVEPSRATLELNNRDGVYSPRNPTSWLYGKIGRNTPLRIMVGADVRFVGEVSEWPQRWDTTGTDVWTPVEASGVLRRLGQGTSPLTSTMFRGLSTLARPPKAYWPCEDGEDSTELGSALGGPPMTFAGGTPELATHTGFKCSAPLPTFSGSQWTGHVPAYIASADPDIQVWFLMQVPSGGAINGEGIFAIHTSGTAAVWRMIYGTGGTLAMLADDQDGFNIYDSGPIAFAVNGKLLRVGVQLETDGADIDWSIDTYEVDASFASGLGGTVTGRTIGRCTDVVMNQGADHDDIAVGHIAVHDEILGLFELQAEVNAYNGETAGNRIERLCEQEGVTFRADGDLDDTSAMGPQLPGQLLDLLREAEDADGGVLYEPRDLFGLAYRPREDMYNRAPLLALDYSAAHLSGIEPTDDDQNVRNDVTVKRTGGASSRAIEATGPLSVNAPPAGVGRYDTEVTLNLELDAQTEDMAGWLLHLGTVDEARFPQLAVELARQVFATNDGLTTEARRLDIGDRLTVDNPPAWLPPDAINQRALGFVERLQNFEHSITVNCAPASPWQQAGIYSDLTVSRYAGAGSTLTATVDSTTTSLSVTTSYGPLWTHDDGDFDIRMGGEVLTVSGVAGASSPQTFTVTRSVNGVIKGHDAGAALELDQPRIYLP